MSDVLDVKELGTIFWVMEIKRKKM